MEGCIHQRPICDEDGIVLLRIAAIASLIGAV